MRAPESSGELLGAPASSWPRSPGSSGELLEALVSFWELRQAPRSCGELLGALASFWELWRAPGSSWELLRALASSWKLWQRLGALAISLVLFCAPRAFSFLRIYPNSDIANLFESTLIPLDPRNLYRESRRNSRKSLRRLTKAFDKRKAENAVQKAKRRERSTEIPAPRAQRRECSAKGAA